MARADQIRAGDPISILNRAATVTGKRALIERGHIGIEGPVHEPREIWWTEITFTWDAQATGSNPIPGWDPPESALVLEGNRQIHLRESWDDPGPGGR